MIIRVISRNLKLGEYTKMLGGCKHARSPNFHYKTLNTVLKKRRKKKAGGGCLDSPLFFYPPPRECKNITNDDDGCGDGEFDKRLYN